MISLKNLLIINLLTIGMININAMNMPDEKEEDNNSIQKTMAPRNLIMIIKNDMEKVYNEDQLDSTELTLLIALAQKSAPIIVSAPILHHALAMRNKGKELTRSVTASLYCSDHSQEEEKKRFVIMSEIPFDHTGWKVYANKSYYLLIPNQQSNVDDGFNINNDNLIEKQIVDLEDPGFLCNASKSIPWDDECLAELTSIFKINSGAWIIYLNGHGKIEKVIAGMPIDAYRKFISFLSKNLIIRLLFYVTCYGGGVNLVNAYTDNHAAIVLPFTIIQAATTESAIAIEGPRYFGPGKSDIARP